MGFAETVLLGAIAGIDDLPRPAVRAHRARRRPRARRARDVLGRDPRVHLHGRHEHTARSIVSSALTSFKHHHTGFGHVLGRFALLAVGFTRGRRRASRSRERRRAPPRRRPRGRRRRAAPATGRDRAGARPVEARRRALQTGMTIAGAIGLHNFAEGLAIGVSARAGAIGLATVLIVGFGAAQRDRGVRDRRPARRRRARRGAGSASPASSAAGRRSSARSSATRSTRRRSSSRSTRSPAARSCT